MAAVTGENTDDFTLKRHKDEGWSCRNQCNLLCTFP